MNEYKWEMLPVPDDPKDKKYEIAVRLNSLASLYFFEKYTLGRSKLSQSFHMPILQGLETDRPRFLLEAPRDHYKTVMVTEGRNMWRVLPFTDRDELLMRELGYGNEWIAWMKRCHKPERRILTVSEVIGNAVKIGYRIDWHYRENKIFKFVFKDILPDSNCKWNEESKQHKCPQHGPNGEGTFDYLGVGGALQSRHYYDITEDDVIGKDALNSELVMASAIEYHRLLIGAFESYKDAAWTVVNNRWAPNDLSGWIRENQAEFVIESHSALGGCCERHPNGVPVFPEEFSLETLEEIRRVQGPYIFSHQYLNLPMNPEECIFSKDWLKFYAPTPSPTKIGRNWLRHISVTKNPANVTLVIKDIDPNTLVRSMIVDPNHAGANGRCRHAIIVTGIEPETDRIYLLDIWAKSMSYDDLCKNIYKMAELWNLPEFWLETVAAQKYLKYHIEYRNKIEKRRLTVRELPSQTGANAKRVRIEALEPLFRDGRVWVREDQNEFLQEYYGYPNPNVTQDVLDCMGFATGTWNAIHAKRILAIMDDRRQKQARRKGHTGY